MKITQGILKWSNVYGVTFEDKYFNIKSIVTKENYTSKFKDVSSTSTILSKSKIYYNTVEDCKLINCDIENGRFINSNLVGLSGITCYINDGYFSGCTISGYIINGGKFYNCVINSNNIWNEGYWDNNSGNLDFQTVWNGGVWNSGIFDNPAGWSGGTFNDGIFMYPAEWYNGVANGGLFSGITWHHGLVRNADFIGCTYLSGTFNEGKFENGEIKGGIFNNGNIINSNINGENYLSINGGNISGTTLNYTINGIDTHINGGNFYNMIINYANVSYMNGFNLTINNGKFYNGKYENSIFNMGDIFYGIYNNISGNTSQLTIHNGLFNKSYFNQVVVHNGNFTNCSSQYITWHYGVYTEGYMYKCTWYDGYWNDGVFIGYDTATSEDSNSIMVIAADCILEAVIECDV